MTTGTARTRAGTRVTVTLRRPSTVCGVAFWLAGNSPGSTLPEFVIFRAQGAFPAAFAWPAAVGRLMTTGLAHPSSLGSWPGDAAAGWR